MLSCVPSHFPLDMDSRISKSSGSRQSRTRSGSNLSVRASETRGGRPRRTARACPPPNSIRAQRLQQALLAATEDPIQPYQGPRHSDVASLPQEYPSGENLDPRHLLDPSPFAPGPSVSSSSAVLSAFPVGPVTDQYSIDLFTGRGNPPHQQTELHDMRYAHLLALFRYQAVDYP